MPQVVSRQTAFKLEEGRTRAMGMYIVLSGVSIVRPGESALGLSIREILTAYPLKAWFGLSNVVFAGITTIS